MFFLQLNYTMKAPTGQPFSGRPVGFSLLSGVALVRQPRFSCVTFEHLPKYSRILLAERAPANKKTAIFQNLWSAPEK